MFFEFVQTHRKSLAVAVATLAAVLLAAAGAAGWRYHRGVSQNEPVAKLSDIRLAPESGVALGGAVSFEASFKCPWHRRPVEASATAGKGARLAGPPEIKKASTGFGNRVWTISGKIIPFRTGEIPDGLLEVTFNRGPKDDAPEKISMKIPALKVEALDTGGSTELSLAKSSNGQASSRMKILLASLAVVVIAAVAAWLWLGRRKGRTAPAFTPWGFALARLNELRDGLGAGRVSCELCLTRLTDIVREYLEQRFKLHAPTLTTGEFLDELNSPASPLKVEHRHFLREFLTSADMVKFAKVPADKGLLGEVMARAESLINETRPAAPDEKKEAVK